MTGDGCPSAALADQFDPTNAAYRLNREPVFAELRKTPPRWTGTFGGMWIVSRYEDIIEATGKPLVFCSSQGTNLPPNGFPYRFPPGESDPPEHVVYRRLTAPFFAPKAVADLEPMIRAVTRSCIDQFASPVGSDRIVTYAHRTTPFPM